MRSWFRSLFVGLYFAATACGAEPVTVRTSSSQKLNFERDIRPIFAKRCFECHGPDTQESNLRLDERASMVRGGKSGRPAFVAGRSAESRLMQVVTGRDAKVSMPPDGPRLSKSELETIGCWIDQGATWDNGLSSSTASKANSEGVRRETSPSSDFWSFQPVRAVHIPPSISTNADGSFAPANPIDVFVQAKLQSTKFRPSSRADNRSLIRRLYMDLLGMPPTPEEIAAFASDAEPLAWSHLIDRVLASSHYGERWARHWLDTVRFAETDGFETNVERPNAFRYRDYVIHALNDDKPYDRFVFDQLAGDAVGADAATGFLVGGPCDKVKSPNVVLTRTQRQDELTDMINTTGTAFLGLTLGCAKCHNHKFDPIPQHDFYAIQAVFAGVKHGDRAVREPNDASHNRLREQTEQRLAQARANLVKAGIRPPIDTRYNLEDFPPIRTRRVRFTILATNDGSEPCLDELEVFSTDSPQRDRNVALASTGARATASSVYLASGFHKLEHINDGRYGNERSWISQERGKGWIEIAFPRQQSICRIVWARDRNGNYKDRLPTKYTIEAESTGGKWIQVADSNQRLQLPTNMTTAKAREAVKLLEAWNQLKAERLRLESASMAYAGQFERPEPVHRLFRGDPMAPRESIGPGALALLGPLQISSAAPEQRRRAALAAWIVRPENPLTARVIVNRLWHYHFGCGIVETPSDFGHNGGRPSHPELLDWLSGELVKSGWSLKHIHRLILTSSTFQQSSAPQSDGLKSDASSRFLWRFPPRRLEAEAIRDSMLAASGVLDHRMDGPGFRVFEPNTNYVRVYRPKEKFGPAEWRRMIYMSKVRMEQDGIFGAFDCPDAGLIAPRRTQSTTALQALNLLNSRFTLEQAELMVSRCRRDVGADQNAGIYRAYELAFGRPPDDVELPASRNLVEKYGFASLCRALFNANEFLFIP